MPRSGTVLQGFIGTAWISRTGTPMAIADSRADACRRWREKYGDGDELDVPQRYAIARACKVEPEDVLSGMQSRDDHPSHPTEFEIRRAAQRGQLFAYD